MSRIAPALRLSSLALLGLSALPQWAQATNGYFAHGYGVNAQAVAGVGIALPQDGLVAATNPAGQAFVADRLDLGVNLFRPSRGAEVKGVAYGGDGKQNFLIPEFGYVRHINEQVHLGLAVYGNGGMNTQYNTNPYSGLGAQGRAGVNLEQLFISPALSLKLSPQQTVGAAINFAHQRFAATGIGFFGGASSAPNNVSDQGTDSSDGVGVRLGWIGQIDPSLRLGATWSSKINGRFDKYKGLFADQGGFDIPANYGVGLAYQPSPQWTFGADYQVIQYSDVKSVGNPLSQLTVQGQPLGASNGPGFGWQDVKVLKLGVIHQVLPSLTLRAGYSHATQAVPADQAFFNVLAPGVVQNHVTLGFTHKLDAHSEVSAVYGHAFKKTVSGTGAIPDSFGGGDANIHLKEDTVGVSYGWKF